MRRPVQKRAREMLIGASKNLALRSQSCRERPSVGDPNVTARNEGAAWAFDVAAQYLEALAEGYEKLPQPDRSGSMQFAIRCIVAFCASETWGSSIWTNAQALDYCWYKLLPADGGYR